MSRSKSRGPIRLNPTARQHYLNVSRRPLQILAFLLPLIIAYELALPWLIVPSGKNVTAHQTLLQFFHAFGIAPASVLYLGGIAIVVVLLVWHLLNRDPWTVDYSAVGIMAVESLALTVPLLVIGQLMTETASPAWSILGLAQQSNGESTLAGLSLPSKLAFSVGAGLYEELLFRMMLIAIVHTLLVDVGKASDSLGATIAVLVSAAAFTLYHQRHAWPEVTFFFLAGVYFGAIYVIRGFGIVVGVHALYDIITVSLLTSSSS